MEIAVVAIPLLVCLAGLLAYALSANPKVVELGRLGYECGLFVTLLVFGHGTVLGGIGIPILVCIVGLLVYALSTPANPKVAVLALITYACGLLAALLIWGHGSVRFL